MPKVQPRNIELRNQLRSLYCFERVPLERAAVQLNIPLGTAQRWKYQARDNGDDWDKVRSAASQVSESLETLGRKLFEDYLLAHNATIESLRMDCELSSADKTTMLCGLADALSKTTKSLSFLMPKTSKLGIALEVIKNLVTHIAHENKNALPDLIDSLQSFELKLAKLYG